MPYGVTADDVRGIYAGIPDGVDLAPFIDLADVVAVERLAGYYGDSYLTRMVKLLAAHFYEVDNPRLRQEQIGVQRATDVLESKVDLGLNLTRPGQQVLMMDVKGRLSVKKQQARTIVWLGEERT